MMQGVFDKMSIQDRVALNVNNVDDLFKVDLSEISEYYIAGDERANLIIVRDRHEAFRSLVSLEDYERVMELKNLMGDEKFKSLSGLDTASPDDIQELFNIRSRAEVNDMIKRAAEIYKAAKTMSD
jgi:hypothetical protein